MLKIRMQGTKWDLTWFEKILQENPEIHVISISDPFANKGTNRYFRVYADIDKRVTNKEKSYR